MDSHRKLLVLALNELLAKKLVSLDSGDETEGHLVTTLAGENAVIIWSGISCGELRLSVWWKYDHSRHPQANLQGAQRESFTTSSPLAKSQHYPSFVGATASCWVERKTAKHLQGDGRGGLFEIYTRRGEKAALDALPIPVPLGFQPEGRFFT